METMAVATAVDPLNKAVRRARFFSKFSKANRAELFGTVFLGTIYRFRRHVIVTIRRCLRLPVFFLYC